MDSKIYQTKTKFGNYQKRKGILSKNFDGQRATWNLILELFKEADICYFNNIYVYLCQQVIIENIKKM